MSIDTTIKTVLPAEKSAMRQLPILLSSHTFGFSASFLLHAVALALLIDVHVRPPKLVGAERVGAGEVTFVSLVVAQPEPVLEKVTELSSVQSDPQPEVSLSTTRMVPKLIKPERQTPPLAQAAFTANRKVGSQSPVGSTLGSTGESGPSLVAAPKPLYPRAARLAGFEGRVELSVLIGSDGEVGEVQILKSSGRADCDESAKRTLLQSWRFEPATSNGIPISWREKIAVAYQLE